MSGEPTYSNPPVAEGINVSDRSPLRSFVWNLAIVALALLAFIAGLEIAATTLAPAVPFACERRLVGDAFLSHGLSQTAKAKQAAISRIADKMSAAMDLPPGMTVSAHYSPGPTVNAFATLGGNILVYEGLLKHCESEDELAMVLAHEMAHVKHRDPGKGVVRAGGLLLLSLGLGDAASSVDILTRIGLAGYSRGQETAADEEALLALGKVYGHVGGAKRFFAMLARTVEQRDPETERASLIPSVMATHPDTLARYARVETLAAEHGFPITGELTPLPPEL